MIKGGGMRAICSFAAAFFVLPAFGQGQDSTPEERDLMVIAEMLEGGYSNANQAYFDYRVDRDPKHSGFELQVELDQTPESGELVFSASGSNGLQQQWAISTAHAENAVRMRVFDRQLDGYCDMLWRREAAQFRATATGCDSGFPAELVLSEQQLWITLSRQNGGDYQLHRVRDFKCYVDIPGVGGGRAIPYDRYGEFEIHDQGGSHWFTSKEGREIGVSLLLVDWPINNYDGVFTP